jgi:hypothetical protein
MNLWGTEVGSAKVVGSKFSAPYVVQSNTNVKPQLVQRKYPAMVIIVILIINNNILVD